MTIKYCIYCQNKTRLAIYPKDDPKYCSMKCIKYRAYESAMDMIWCEIHKEWYDRREGCDLCNEEKLE